MFFTQEDYKKIQQWLTSNSVKDTEFNEANIPFNGEETITIVQGNQNKRVFLKDLVAQVFNLGISDFVNITDKYDASNISLEEAIRLIPSRARKEGQVITFLDKEDHWHIYQFKGALNQWSVLDQWEDLFDWEKLIIDSILPDEEDLTKSPADANGNSYLSLKDREYNPEDFSGLGRVILRKNIIEVEDPIYGKVKKNVLYQDMFTQSNTVYECRYDFDLNGQNITLPDNSYIEYNGGSINNGTILDAAKGMNRIVLKKNIINGKNILAQELINKPNTIYIIQYNYDLNGAEIPIPENCILQFEGGFLSNGTIVGNNTTITSGGSVVFGEHIALNGSWSGHFLIDWFGDIKEYNKDNPNDSSFIINRAVQIVPSGNTLILNKSNIFINDSIVINKELNVQLYSKIFYGGENTKPTIIIHDTARMSLEVFDIINVSPVFNYREDASYEYNVSVVLENVTDSIIKIRKIENYCTGVFLFGNNGGVHYNKIEVLDFYACFNGVRITSNEGGWCNGNVIEKCAYNYRSWSNIGEWVPYFIVSNSYKSNGTPYVNNGNVFQNITLEYNPTVATQYPKLLKAENAIGYRINVDRVELPVGEDGMHDLVHLGNITRAIVINVVYSYYKIKPLAVEASHNLLIQQGGGRVVGFTPYVLNLKDSLVFEEGINPIHVIYKIDTITGLVVFNAVLSITSAVSTIVYIAAPTTINVIAGFRSEGSTLWTTPEIVETIPIILSTGGKLSVMSGTIAAKSVLYINASYYLFDNV